MSGGIEARIVEFGDTLAAAQAKLEAEMAATSAVTEALSARLAT